MTEHQAVYTCAGCGKKTELTDQEVNSMSKDGTFDAIKSSCECPDFAKYFSRVTAKFPVDFSKWKILTGSSE